MILTQASENTH